MAFVRIPGIEGSVFIPTTATASQKKHRCPDCFVCQMCTDSRCRLCRPDTGQTGASGDCRGGQMTVRPDLINRQCVTPSRVKGNPEPKPENRE